MMFPSRLSNWFRRLGSTEVYLFDGTSVTVTKGNPKPKLTGELRGILYSPQMMTSSEAFYLVRAPDKMLLMRSSFGDCIKWEPQQAIPSNSPAATLTSVPEHDTDGSWLTHHHFQALAGNCELPTVNSENSLPSPHFT